MRYYFKVIERYPDPIGGTWTYYYFTIGAAKDAQFEMQKAHPARTYELVAL